MRHPITDAERHKAALAYIRPKTHDAAAPPERDELHVHIHGAGQDLPASVGNSLPPKGKLSGSPIKTTDDPTMAAAGPGHLPREEIAPQHLPRAGDDRETDEQQGRPVATLDPAPEGQRYILEPLESGEVAVVPLLAAVLEFARLPNVRDKFRDRFLDCFQQDGDGPGPRIAVTF